MKKTDINTAKSNNSNLEHLIKNHSLKIRRKSYKIYKGANLNSGVNH
jgi:hypothetical protein